MHIPAVEIAHNGNAYSIWSPYTETIYFFSIYLYRVNAEEFISFVVLALIKKVQRKFIFFLIVRIHYASLLLTTF